MRLFGGRPRLGRKSGEPRALAGLRMPSGAFGARQARKGAGGRARGQFEAVLGEIQAFLNAWMEIQGWANRHGAEAPTVY